MAVRVRGNVYKVSSKQSVGLSASGQAIGYVTPNPHLSIQEQYQQLAKQADQRLVRLEKLASQKGFESATTYSYGSAMRDIAGTFGEGVIRFNRKLPDNAAKQQKMLRAVQKFLNSPTSTKTGIISTYKHKADVLNERYGTNFMWQDLKEYFDKVADKIKDDKLSSKTFLVAIGQVQEDPGAMIEGITEVINNNQTSDSEVDKSSKIDSYLSDLGLSIKDLTSKNPARVGEAIRVLSTHGSASKAIKDRLMTGRR